MGFFLSGSFFFGFVVRIAAWREGSLVVPVALQQRLEHSQLLVRFAGPIPQVRVEALFIHNVAVCTDAVADAAASSRDAGLRVLTPVSVLSDPNFRACHPFNQPGITKRIAPVALRMTQQDGASAAARFDTTFDIDRTEFGLNGVPKMKGFNIPISKRADSCLYRRADAVTGRAVAEAATRAPQ